MKRIALLIVVVLEIVALSIAANPAPAGAATTTLAEWQMNEGPGATTMVDSSGNGMDGTIGSGVQTAATFGGSTGYRWAFASPTLPPAKPERLVQVWDDRLNPESEDYAVTIRYRTIQPFGNIIQKGQGGAKGGYFKLENPGGILTCVFRGVSASGSWQRKQVTSVTPLNDGQWHTARCERTSDKLTLTVDGTLRDTAGGSSGNISNTRPITIAGKYNCDQISITCDYFTGDIDSVKIEIPLKFADPETGPDARAGLYATVLDDDGTRPIQILDHLCTKVRHQQGCVAIGPWLRASLEAQVDRPFVWVDGITKHEGVFWVLAPVRFNDLKSSFRYAWTDPRPFGCTGGGRAQFLWDGAAWGQSGGTGFEGCP